MWVSLSNRLSRSRSIAMTTKVSKIIVLLLATALVVSGALNVWCARRALSYCRALNLFRLDPVGMKVFAAQNPLLPEPEEGKVRIILFGDSRVAYWRPLPSLQNCQWVNRGIGGQTTAQTLLRLEDDVISLKPAIVILEVGMNDLKTVGILPNSRDEIISSCRENIGAIVSQIREHEIQAVVLTVFPRGPVDLLHRPTWSDDISRGVEQVNEMIRNLKSGGVTVVDCDPILTSGGIVKPEYARDTFHLTSAGYEALNSSLAPLLSELAKSHLTFEN
jgi:lysophospholipase L1-like esterase